MITNTYVRIINEQKRSKIVWKNLASFFLLLLILLLMIVRHFWKAVEADVLLIKENNIFIEPLMKYAIYYLGSFHN